MTAPSEYSYFDTGRFGGWAGPRHWKFKPLQRQGGALVFRSSANAQQSNGDEETAAKRKKTALKNLDEIHDFLMLLESSLEEMVTNGSTGLDRLEKNMSQINREQRTENRDGQIKQPITEAPLIILLIKH